MARQSTTPIQFNRTQRVDQATVMTSGRAGNVQMLTYFPLHRGDSASGSVGIDVELAQMPRPTLNAVQGNFQAWYVPKTAFPQFSGSDEFMHSYHGENIKALGAADREPPAFFLKVGGSDLVTALGSEMFKDLGLHVPAGTEINTDLIDAFWLVYNFRLAAHSSRLVRQPYASEDIAKATKWPRAFWPTGRFSRVVPDYERALIVGNLDLDILAGQVTVQSPVTKVGGNGTSSTIVASDINATRGKWTQDGRGFELAWGELVGDMSGETIGITLADIDKARTTQAFAKLRTAYAGNDATGFDNDNAIIAELMQGFRVPEDQFKRPWLLDSKRVTFGMAERHAMDGASLDQSVTQGRASAVLSLNVPANESGGVVIVTLEVLPERIDERMQDDWLEITSVSQLPDALRDVQRPEPVDLVKASRLDARHSSPNSLYGYEPMNDKWNREFTRLGGAFYQADPLNPWKEQRSAIWQAAIVDPEFTDDHYLAPADFPHDVFADTQAPAFECVTRHAVTIVGLTQIGDVLAENNDDYAAVTYDQNAE